MTHSEFQTSHHSIAVILDEHGGTAGIITAEDVFEELLGDFEDEFDTDNIESQQLEDGSIIADAKIDWETFNNKFGTIIPNGDYETIAGFVLYNLGNIPSVGDSFMHEYYRFEITEMKNVRIEQIKITKTRVIKNLK